MTNRAVSVFAAGFLAGGALVIAYALLAPARPRASPADPAPTAAPAGVESTLSRQVDELEKRILDLEAALEKAGKAEGAPAGFPAKASEGATQDKASAEAAPKTPAVPPRAVAQPPPPVRVEDQGTIEGYVFESPGKPAVNVAVMAHSAAGQASTLTDERGCFRLSGLAPGSWSVQPRSVHAAEGKWPSRNLDLGPGETKQLTFGGSGLVRVEGQAFDSGGKPIARTTVFLMSSWPYSEFVCCESTTDESGRFVFENVAPARYNWSLGRGEGRSFGSGTVTVPESCPFTLTIALPPTRVEGIVARRSDGQPVKGATVSFHPAGRGGLSSLAWTGADGKFLVEGLQPGMYRIWVQCEGFASTEASPFELPANGTVSGLRVELSPAARLVIRVTDPAGNPFPGGVEFRAMGPRGTGTSCTRTLDDRGQATIDSLAPGTYSFTVEAPGWRRSIRSGVELDEGENPVLGFVLERK